MAFLHKSDGKNGQEAGTFLKLNWGVTIGILATISIAIFGVVNAANTSAHSGLDLKIEKMVGAVDVLSKIVSGNCTEIAVLKNEVGSTKEVLGKLDTKLEAIRKDQIEYYISRGFKSKSILNDVMK